MSAVTLTKPVSAPRLSLKDDITRQLPTRRSVERARGIGPQESTIKPVETSTKNTNTVDSIGEKDPTEATSINDLFDDGSGVEERLASTAFAEENRLEPRIDSKDGYPQVAGVFCIVFVVGALSLCWGIFMPRIIDDMNISLAVASFAGALLLTIRAGVAPWAGSWPGRFGSQRVVAVGSILVCVGLIGSSFAIDIWELYVCYSLMVGMGLSLLLYPGSYIIIQWYSKKKSMMLGFGLGSLDFGGFVYNIVAALLIERYGWRDTLRLTVGMVLVLTITGVLLIRDRLPPKKVSTRLDWYLFRNPRFLLVFLCNISFSFGKRVPTFFTVIWAERHGMSSTIGAIATGLMALSGGIGIPVQGWIGDRTARDTVFVVNMLCAGAVLFIWPVCKTEWSLLLVSVLCGFLIAGQTANTAAIITDWFPKHEPGKISGLSSAGRAIGELFGPVLTAAFFDSHLGAAYMLSGALMMFTGISIYIGSVWQKISNKPSLDNVLQPSVAQVHDIDGQKSIRDLSLTDFSKNSNHSQQQTH
eukprot:Clim_evm4s142 gene=Clim_evmTU4s142